MLTVGRTGFEFDSMTPSRSKVACLAVGPFSFEAKMIIEVEKFELNLSLSRFVEQMAAKVVTFKTGFEYRPFVNHF